MDFIQRMEVELGELVVKIEKLNDFRCSDEYCNMPSSYRRLLVGQFKAMGDYRDALAARLAIHKQE